MVCIWFINGIKMISINSVIASQFDKSALDFISAANLTIESNRLAIQYLVVQLKAKGLWNKMRVIYPFVGGNATSHRYNLKNPALTTAAFAITFTGGWTHSANGIQGNGTTNVGNTNFNPRSHLTSATSTSHGIYVRNNVTGIYAGCNNSALGAAQNYLIISRNSSTIYTLTINSESTTFGTMTTASAAGFNVFNRTSSTNIRGYQNGSKLLDTTQALTNSPSFNYYIGCRNNAGSAGNYTTAEIAFHYIGDTLTDNEVSDMYTIIQQYQTILGRQV